jgi:hypothetical protein
MELKKKWLDLLKEKKILPKGRRKEFLDLKLKKKKFKNEKIKSKIYVNCSFDNVDYKELYIENCIFINCSFKNISFEKASVSLSFFLECEFEKVNFTSLDQLSLTYFYDSVIHEDEESYQFMVRCFDEYRIFLESKRYATVEIEDHLSFRKSVWDHLKRGASYRGNFLHAMCAFMGTQVYGKDGTQAPKKNILFSHHCENWRKLLVDSKFMSIFTSVCTLEVQDEKNYIPIVKENRWIFEMVGDDLDDYFENEFGNYNFLKVA